MPCEHNAILELLILLLAHLQDTFSVGETPLHRLDLGFESCVLPLELGSRRIVRTACDAAGTAARDASAVAV